LYSLYLLALKKNLTLPIQDVQQLLRVVVPERLNQSVNQVHAANGLLVKDAVAANGLQPYAVGAFNHCTNFKSTKL
jgi:hypothetical protein